AAATFAPMRAAARRHPSWPRRPPPRPAIPSSISASAAVAAAPGPTPARTYIAAAASAASAPPAAPAMSSAGCGALGDRRSGTSILIDLLTISAPASDRMSELALRLIPTVLSTLLGAWLGREIVRALKTGEARGRYLAFSRGESPA